MTKSSQAIVSLMQPCYILLNRQYEYATKNRENAGLAFMRNFTLVKVGLNIFLWS